ncbi:MAG: corrinoid protein [Oscillospiraceae bacterium]|nr:corrinoid protein [Oscillospiraceae bacterium]
MSILADIGEALEKGKRKLVVQYVQQALDEGVAPQTILTEGLLPGMDRVGVKFRNNEIFVPEVLVAARAMSAGTELLKPLMADGEGVSLGTAVIGTVKGDLHDIGKNLVKMMIEGKGINVIDLGVDVAPETFVQAAIDNKAQLICCSALLTTTMPSIAEVVKAVEAAGIRDQVKIMVGGAPVTQEFADSVGADAYTPDAATAAVVAAEFLKG